MFISLKPLIKWPSREELQKSMPMDFRSNFKKCTVIIDCFEIYVFVLHVDLHSILLFFLYVLKSISEIGAYSTFLQLGDNHEHGPEVQDASFLIWLMAST